ncbi:chemotaxis protein CheA [Pantoea dispersa]|jgi:two-component system, chemotaxis family, sensor kinase CheA|uniref:chemotaxis protein CheA n=1 Tax=Pantoea dispersa TaxID=59814 RepID=UPI0021AE6F14|nr:chemotaxis protein CheA [Pantoea dispersa]MCT6588429.1 chemotaxis protein CheA [Pantoea dispersa]
MDVSDFYQTFFEEADELLADMEQHLLLLDVAAPDKEMLNAIFRAAHSIKGGAGTFGFTVLQETTHIMENLLDDARQGKLSLTSNIINLFLESKDIMQSQLDAYKASQQPDQASFHAICEALRQIALADKQPPVAAVEPQPVTVVAPSGADEQTLVVTLREVAQNEQSLLLEELAHLGAVVQQASSDTQLQVELRSTASAEEISAVLCFVLDAGQISVSVKAEPAAPVLSVPASAVGETVSARQATAAPRAAAAESGSIRVAVEKVDQIINQVGELIITQAMLSQLSGVLDPAHHHALLSSIGQLERNARDLQESVMSVRMMPMEYVFSRFPRLVHDLGGKLQKEIELTLKGGSAELDKSLIERIIDPLTHLVRNSLDHGIEPVEMRVQKGKPAKGNLTLSAEHHGGNIVIEVTDDGAGLNREKILARAHKQGLSISDNASDEEVWMLIFAAGFSTAEQVTDVSGRGVGMDVVRRNILAMGGHVEVHSEADRGTTIRIILPLTLAILDGMSVMVGDEVYVLPLSSVMESLRPSDSMLNRLAGDEQLLQVRGEYLTLIELKQVFAIPGAPRQTRDKIAVIVQSAGCRYALLVDQLIGQHQVVVKNLEMNYRKVPGVSAATILGDGSVALILDVVGLSTLAKSQKLEHKHG